MHLKEVNCQESQIENQEKKKKKKHYNYFLRPPKMPPKLNEKSIC